MRSIVITGVSRGLGAALFEEFHRAGDRILALGRRFTDGQHAAERAEPQRIRLRPVDLAHYASLPPAAELGSFAHDATDVVMVHNAAVLEPVGAIGALIPDRLAYAVAVNLTAPMVLTNALIGTGLFGSGRRLTVLFISSGAAHTTIGGWSVYGATKRGAESFFEGLAAQFGPDDRIRVVNVQPGVMDTDMQATVRQFANSESVYFPDRGRFLGLHQRGELVPPAQAARQIIATHLDGAVDRTYGS